MKNVCSNEGEIEIGNRIPEKNKVTEMSPSEWLMDLRTKYGYDRKFHIPKSSLEDYISRIPEKNRDEARQIWMNRYKMTISEIQNELMQQYLQEMTPILSTEEKEIADNTFFGILPTHDFNGYAGFTPRGDRVVVLHEGLGFTINFWTKWYLRYMEEGRDYLLNTAELCSTLKYILQFWYGYLLPGTKNPDIYPRTQDSWDLAECLTLSAISFVLGHEIGHILKKHPAYTPNKIQNHAFEYEADQIGLAITIRHSFAKTLWIQGDTYYTKLMLFGPLFATAVMSLFGDTSSHTHPSPSERGVRLIQNYKVYLRQLLKDDGFEMFLDNVDRNVLDIFQKNKDKLFLIFTGYRDLMDSIDIGPRKVDNSWLCYELNAHKPPL